LFVRRLAELHGAGVDPRPRQTRELCPPTLASCQRSQPTISWRVQTASVFTTHWHTYCTCVLRLWTIASCQVLIILLWQNVVLIVFVITIHCATTLCSRFALSCKCIDVCMPLIVYFSQVIANDNLLINFAELTLLPNANNTVLCFPLCKICYKVIHKQIWYNTLFACPYFTRYWQIVIILLLKCSRKRVIKDQWIKLTLHLKHATLWNNMNWPQLR